MSQNEKEWMKKIRKVANDVWYRWSEAGKAPVGGLEDLSNKFKRIINNDIEFDSDLDNEEADRVKRAMYELGLDLEKRGLK